MNSSKAGMCLKHFYPQADAVCGPDWPLSIHLSKEREPTLGITVTVLTLRAVTVLTEYYLKVTTDFGATVKY